MGFKFDLRGIILFTILLSLLIPSAFAVRYIEYDFKDGVVYPGYYIPGDNPVTQVNALGFICYNEGCTNNDPLWGGDVIESGNSDSMVLEYPTELQGLGYGVYFYNEGRITWEQGEITYAGDKPGEDENDPTFWGTAYLTEASMCRAQIDTFEISNVENPFIPVIVNVTASLDATTHSALTHGGPLDYVPPELLDDYYSIWTNINLQIFDSDDAVVFDESTDVLIEFSGEARTEFEWIPQEAGDYKAIITSFAVDDKCLASEEMSATSEFTVLQDEPNASCYTLLQNLSAIPLNANLGDDVEISLEKLSNAVIDNDFTALPTNMTLRILDEFGVVVHEEKRLVSANDIPFSFQTVDFEWMSTISGTLTIWVHGIADQCPYDENLDEIETINFHVEETPECNDGIDNDGDGFIDYPNDFGCSSLLDDDETNNGNFQCNNGFDDDSDGLIDQEDPLCETYDDDSEFGQCNDFIDNDGDGWVDLIDPGCDHENDDSESFVGDTECSDEVDNDNDGLIDGNDPMCSVPGDPTETAECQDGIDNDGDGLTDYPKDPGCSDPNDNDESDDMLSECEDGIDNDGDGAIDYPDDFSCSSPQDEDESLPEAECQNGEDDDGDGLVDYPEDPGCASNQDNDESNGEIECSSDSDCPNSKFVGDPFCRDNDIHRNFRIYECVNPGELDSFCGFHGEVRFLETCDLCDNGKCREFSGTAGSGDLFVSDISFGSYDRFTFDDQMFFSISLKNDGFSNMEDLGIAVTIWDLGEYFSFGSIDLDKGDVVTISKIFDVPYVYPGVYDARIVVSNDDLRRVIHREIVIM